MAIQGPLIVLGSSGWLGHYVIPALRTLMPDREIIAVFRSRKPVFPARGISLRQAATDSIHDLESLPPGTLINLNRGDWSEEIDFVRRLAREFGYDSAQVNAQVIEDEATPCNAILGMERFEKTFPGYIIPTERETLMKVAAQPELGKYRGGYR